MTDRYRDSICSDCQKLTAGDCGRHRPALRVPDTMPLDDAALREQARQQICMARYDTRLARLGEVLARIGKIAHGDASDDFEDDNTAVAEIERLVDTALADAEIQS
mgnify:CR=1 FL=1